MSYGVTYTVGGVTYNLTGPDAATGLDMHYIGALNLGGSPMHAITTRGALQQGLTRLDYRLDPRVITLAWVVYGNSLGEMTSQFDALNTIFNGSNKKAVLTFTRDDGSIRAIDCFYHGGLDNDIDPKLYQVRVPVQLLCPDPTFYDPSLIADNLFSGVQGTATSYPYVIPVTYGSAFNGATQVVYTGTAVSYPIIEVTGPINAGLSITNEATGDNITTSAAIPAGSTWRFDLRYGQKTVKNQSGVNQLPNITSGSDIATFALVPAPTVYGGVNNIILSGTGATSATAVNMYFFTRYQGM